MIQIQKLRLFQLAFSSFTSYFRNLNNKDNNLSITDTRLFQYNGGKSNIFLFGNKRFTIAIGTIAPALNTNNNVFTDSFFNR